MKLEMLKSKIHRARITACEKDYEGSIEIDSDLMRKAGLLPFEKVLVANAMNGERLETYVIRGKAGSRVMMLNGPAALKGSPGDIVTIMAFCHCGRKEARKLKPTVIVLDEKNEIVGGGGRRKRAGKV